MCSDFPQIGVKCSKPQEFQGQLKKIIVSNISRMCEKLEQIVRSVKEKKLKMNPTPGLDGQRNFLFLWL